MDYIYKIHVVRVVDGDTIDAIVELGFDITINKRIRLHGIDAPETRTRDKAEKIRGKKSKEYLEHLCEKQHNVLYLKSIDRGKYGRCVGILFEQDFDDYSINELMIREGHATEYK
jgi:micrococcal nuclease